VLARNRDAYQAKQVGQQAVERTEGAGYFAFGFVTLETARLAEQLALVALAGLNGGPEFTARGYPKAWRGAARSCVVRVVAMTLAELSPAADAAE
jgi:hypothetical protein